MATTKNIATTTEVVELTNKKVLDLFTDPATDWNALSFSISSPEETAARITARELAAKSIDDLLGGSETISGKNYVGKSWCFIDVEWLPSDIAGEGLPFYALIHAANHEGEAITITCGARSVMRKLAIMKANGWAGNWVKIVKSDKKTEAGYEPLDLAKGIAPEEAF